MRKAAKILNVILLAFFVSAFSFAFLTLDVSANDASKSNSETGYKVIIEDDAEVLTDAQIQSLIDKMYSLTEYGNVALKTIDYNDKSSSAAYSENYYYSKFGNSSGVVLLIDFYYRNIIISSDGEMYKTITKATANTITDNVYTFASGRDYFGCASEAFSQVLTKMQGKSIAEPMKHINNILIALIAALVINFIIVSRKAKLRKAKFYQIVESAKYCSLRSTEPQGVFLKTTKEYKPLSKGSGGFGGFGGGGGGGFGGGSGGHRF